MLIKRITFRCLNRRQVHPIARAYSDQARAAHMHFPNRGRHLRDRLDILDRETVR